MFKTDNLLFDHLRVEDAEFTFKLRNGNYEYAKSMIISPFPTSIEREKEWIRNLYNENNRAYFASRTVKENELIGYCFLNEISFIHRFAYVGVIISEDRTGNGFGTDMVNFITNYGFENLALNKLLANVLSNNTSSIRVFEKNMYKIEGTLKKQYFISGEWKDLDILARTKHTD